MSKEDNFFEEPNKEAIAWTNNFIKKGNFNKLFEEIKKSRELRPEEKEEDLLFFQRAQSTALSDEEKVVFYEKASNYVN